MRRSQDTVLGQRKCRAQASSKKTHKTQRKRGDSYAVWSFLNSVGTLRPRTHTLYTALGKLIISRRQSRRPNSHIESRRRRKKVSRVYSKTLLLCGRRYLPPAFFPLLSAIFLQSSQYHFTDSALRQLIVHETYSCAQTHGEGRKGV